MAIGKVVESWQEESLWGGACMERLQERIDELLASPHDAAANDAAMEVSEAAGLLNEATRRLAEIAERVAFRIGTPDRPPETSSVPMPLRPVEAASNCEHSASSATSIGGLARRDGVAKRPEDASERFGGIDPYQRWLGISPSAKRPLNAYGLLGILEFESNVEKIEAGFKRMKSKLESVRMTVDAEHWRIVSEELESAKDALCKRERREELDAAIRRSAAEGGRGEGAKIAPADARIRCHCGEGNHARRVYCTRCGDSLWRSCAACNTERAVDEGHCGHCGVHLDEAERQLLGECQQKIDNAMELANQHKFDEAVTGLRRILLIEDARLEPLIQTANALRDEIFVQQVAATEDLQSRFSAANACIENGDLKGAARLMLEAPESLRTDEFTAVLDRVLRQIKTIKDAEQQIQALLKKKQISDLAHPIEQILAIKPGHPKVTALAHKVRDQLCHAVRARLEANNLELAREFLECIPEPAVNDEVLELREALKDRSGLLKHLLEATVVSRNHLTAAKRLVVLTGSEESKSLYESAQKAWDAANKVPLAPWRTAPQETAVGCPVDWQLYPSVEVVDDMKQMFVSQPGIWFVAAGLALQGLGLARRDINFVDKKSSIAGLFGRKQDFETMWGIDVGAHHIKALRLRRNGDHVVCDRVEKMVNPPGNLDAALLESLGRLRDKHGLANENVAVALSSKFANIRTTMLPPLKGKKLEPILEQEAAAIFPMDVTDVRWRCDVGHLDDERQVGVFVAVKTSTIQKEVTRWTTALGIKPKVVSVDAIAARNAWAWRNDRADDSVAVLDIGETASVLSLESSGKLWVRVLNTAGGHMTEAISKSLKATRQQAEATKHDFSEVENIRPMFDALHEVMQRLRGDVNRAVDALSKEFDELKCQRLTCIGGGSLMTGLIDTLRRG